MRSVRVKSIGIRKTALLGILAIASTTGCNWPADVEREADGRITIEARMRAVQSAVIQYEDQHGGLPPLNAIEPGGNKLVSWRSVLRGALDGQAQGGMAFEEEIDGVRCGVVIVALVDGDGAWVRVGGSRTGPVRLVAIKSVVEKWLEPGDMTVEGLKSQARSSDVNSVVVGWIDNENVFHSNSNH